MSRSAQPPLMPGARAYLTAFASHLSRPTAMSDATINDAIAPADAMHLYGNAAICGTPKARITVMLGSDRNRVLAAWLPQLEQARDFDLQGGPVSDATRIARALDRRKPKVLLLDKALF